MVKYQVRVDKYPNYGKGTFPKRKIYEFKTKKEANACFDEIVEQIAKNGKDGYGRVVVLLRSVIALQGEHATREGKRYKWTIL